MRSAIAVGLIEQCRAQGGYQDAGEVAALMLACAPTPVFARGRWP
jgi:hypothetical protein